jgi:hypothetical protein
LLSIRKRYRIDRKSVCRLKFIFEAYDGIAMVSTTDPYAAEVELRIPPGCEADADDLIRDLGRDMIIECVNSSD